jgi:beta-1,2-mannosyltransferase
MRIKTVQRSRRLIRYTLLLTFIGLAYYFWPVQQIEKLTDSLTASEKNDYIESIINPTRNDIYDAGEGSLKVDFNPDNNDLDHKTVIDLEKVNKALNKVKLKPLADKLNNDESSIPDKKVEILSDTLTKKIFKPIVSLPAYLGNLNIDKSLDYYKDLTCDQISYYPNTNERDIAYSEPILLDDDLIEVRRWLLNSKYENIVKKVDPQANDGTFLSDLSHWFKRSGSSIWLPDEQLHMVVSTIMYAPNERSKPLISFIRLQLFDVNWVEVKGRRIRYYGVTEKEIDEVLREYAKSNDESHLERISLRFPSILNIPFEGKPGKGTIGPEDPKILLKDGEFSSEPIIVFNMLTSDNKRNMFAVFPLQGPKGPDLIHPVLKFKNIGNNAITTLKTEKNWSPFFDSIKIGDSRISKGFMYFAYTLDPLVIFKCSLDSGKCNKVQDNIQYSKFAKEGNAYLRGGTSFIPVPRQIIQTLNDENYQRLQMWIGLPKILNKNNACGNNVYRTGFTLLIKEDGIFRIELITGPIDFGLPTANECSDIGQKSSSIISADGISFWDIASTGQQEDGKSIPYYNDYMGIIVGEGNTKIELIVLKNVLNYAMGVYSYGKYMFGNYDVEGESGVAARTQKVCECALDSALKYGAFLGGGDPFLEKTIEN